MSKFERQFHYQKRTVFLIDLVFVLSFYFSMTKAWVFFIRTVDYFKKWSMYSPCSQECKHV